MLNNSLLTFGEIDLISHQELDEKININFIAMLSVERPGQNVLSLQGKKLEEEPDVLQTTKYAQHPKTVEESQIWRQLCVSSRSSQKMYF